MKYKIKYIREVIKRLDPNKPINTRLQKSGMGSISNSHSLKIGKSYGFTAINRHEKTLDNIYKQRGDILNQYSHATLNKDKDGVIHILYKNKDYTLDNIKDNPELYNAIKKEKKEFKTIEDCLLNKLKTTNKIFIKGK